MMLLWLQIGVFIWRLPRILERQPLDLFLAEQRRKTRVRGRDVGAAVNRIGRIRRRWLRLGPWKRRNTCYTRALVLFRYLDPHGGQLQFHLGTEPSRAAGANIHGHAWVSLDGRVLEPLPGEIAGRVQELYVFPPPAGGASRVPAFEGLAKKPAAQA
jgi:hypothetical protein